MPYKTRNMLWIALMTGLTCLGGWVRIPFLPVPITLQTLFVYLSGILLGPWPGLISQCLYLAIGLSGIPVFTAGGGLSYVLNPTFGYLLGFPVSAWTTGMLIKMTENMTFWKVILCLSVGMGIILGLGVIGLMIHTRWIAGKPIDAFHLLWAGMLIFLPGEICKIVLAGNLFFRLRLLISRGTS